MIAIRHLIVPILVALAMATPPAHACSISPKAKKRFLDTVAATAYLVRARVVRGFDVAKRQPEQLEIEKVFVGGDLPRFVTLDRDKEFFDERTPPPGVEGFLFLDSCSLEYEKPWPNAQMIVLYPASSETGATIPGVFRLGYFHTFARPGRKLNVMLDQAKRNGRLRERPRRSDFPPELGAY